MAEPLRTLLRLILQMIAGLAFTVVLLSWYVGHRRDWWTLPASAVVLVWGAVAGYGLFTGRLHPSSDLNFYLSLGACAAMMAWGIRAIAWAISQRRAAQKTKQS